MAPELKPLLTEGAMKRTFKRRILGLKKKISELSILCDVDACFGKKGKQEAKKGSKRKRKRKEEQLSSSYLTCDHGLKVRALDSKIDYVKNRIALCEKQKEITSNQLAALLTIPLVSENQQNPLDNYLPMFSYFDLGIESYSNLGTVDSTASVVGFAGLPTNPLVFENQPKPLDNYLPMFYYLDLGIESYNNLGTVDSTASVVGFAGPETRHKPINLNFVIESYGKVGTADSIGVSFAGPETRHLPLFFDLNFESYGNVGATDLVVNEVSLAGPETIHQPMFSDLGFGIESYGNLGADDLAVNEVGLAGPETIHQPMFFDLGFGIESYGNVGAADLAVNELDLAGPETIHHPVFSDLDFGINVDRADSVASKAGFSGPETRHLLEATECGVQELYRNEGTCDQPTCDICLW